MPNSSDIKPIFRVGGAVPTAADLQTLIRMIPRMIQGDNKTIQVRTFGDRLIIQAIDRPSIRSGTSFKRFRVKSEEADHLVCRTYNATTNNEGAVDILIAKPYLLRRTPFDGTAATVFPNGQNITYVYTANDTRTADDGTNSETQRMTPQYFIDDQILAMVPSGGTGVIIAGTPPTIIIQEDANTAGRFWSVV